MLVVDARHRLEDGALPVGKPRLYKQMLRIARFIEYGGRARLALACCGS